MKKILNIVLFIFLAGSACLAQNEYKDALSAIKNKDYAKALSIAQQLFQKDSVDTSIKILLNLREVDSQNKAVFDLLGDAYLKSGVKDLAIINYQKELALDSTDVPLRIKLAQVFYKDKKYTDAVNEYLKILAIQPDNKDALFNAAKIFYLAKLYGDAVVYFEKYIKIDPGNVTADTCLVKSYIKTAKYDSAAVVADRSLKLLPGNIQLIKMAAEASYYNNNFENTLSYYSQLPDTSFTYDDYIDAGRSAQRLKKDSIAIDYLVKAFNNDSNKTDLTMDIANLYYTNQKYEKAAEFYGKKVLADSTYEPAYRFRGFAYLQLKDYNQVKENLKKAIALNDTVIASYFWLAQSYRMMDSTNKAISAFQDVIDKIGTKSGHDEELEESDVYLGQVYFERKQYGQAIPYLIKALRYKPNNVNLNLLVATAYHSSGDTDNAIKYYKKVLTLDPKNEIAKKGLRLLSAD